MSNYGKAQWGGPWEEGWLSFFPSVCIDANSQIIKLVGWIVDAEASSCTSLLLKFLDSSEQGGVTLGSCSLPGSKRETIAIKARPEGGNL